MTTNSDVLREDSLTTYTPPSLENPGSTPEEPVEAKGSDKEEPVEAKGSDKEGSGGGLKSATIGGVVAGIIFLFIIILMVTFFIYRKR